MYSACTAYRGGKVCTGFWWGNLREKENLEDPGVEFKMNLQEVGCVLCTGSSWFRIGTGGGRL